MSDDDFELIRGSGNVFRDLGDPDADINQLKAILAAKIIGVLDARGFSVRKAQELTGFAAADFSRVRQAKLARFTIDRLMSMLNKLGLNIEVTVQVQPQPDATEDKQSRAA
jgi:predicted XRE-type DNA-binding protein